MAVFAGQGDAARSMPLLWREKGAAGHRHGPGPKPGLTVDAVVSAAIGVADDANVAGLSMRAVAERLGVTAMALYTYVPGKNELIDLIYDGVHAELPTDGRPASGWRAAVTAWAEDLVALYVRHPWALQVSFARPVLGPHEQAVLEALVRILRETGAGAEVLRRVVSVLFHLVRGTARTIAEARIAPTAGSTSEQEWWAGRAAQLAEVVPDFAERFPQTMWLAGAGAARTGDGQTPYLEHEAREALAVGLAVLLDGLEAGTVAVPSRGR
ncbi:TetR/AcrR family transcriptional regulator C-terminal domain-containing protein [Pseudonocardia sp.]|uniref:TetR/AcrR family transcriptional regulator C-terminal domain-containing protein n=1 Tax=Pseudonocardia sp. TaxID=60912 RepID=UPI0031FDB62A